MTDTKRTTCMITGDAILRDGVFEDFREPGDEKGGQFMKYETSISTMGRVVLTGEHDPLRDVLLEVWVPLRMVTDKPTVVICNIKGRLHLPSSGRDFDSALSNGNFLELGPDAEKPIIEVVQLHQYPFNERTKNLESVFIQPTVFVIAKVLSKSRVHDVLTQSRIFEGQTSSFIKGEYKETELRFLLKGQMSSWRPMPNSLILALAKFAVVRNDGPTLQITYINVLSADIDSTNAPSTPLPAVASSEGLTLVDQGGNVFDESRLSVNNKGLNSFPESSCRSTLRANNDVVVNIRTNELGRENKRLKTGSPKVEFNDQKLGPGPISIVINFQSDY